MVADFTPFCVNRKYVLINLLADGETHAAFTEGGRGRGETEECLSGVLDFLNTIIKQKEQQNRERERETEREKQLQQVSAAKEAKNTL